MVEGGLIDIPRLFQLRGEFFRIEIVGFHEIVQGVAVVPQLGVDEAEKQVGIHGGEIGKIHAAGWTMRRGFRKHGG